MASQLMLNYCPRISFENFSPVHLLCSRVSLVEAQSKPQPYIRIANSSIPSDFLAIFTLLETLGIDIVTSGDVDCVSTTGPGPISRFGLRLYLVP